MTRQFVTVTGFGRILIAALVLIWVAPGYGSPCITPDLLDLSGTHTKILPFGCALTNDAPFTFTGVPGANDISQNVTINTFEQFASIHGVGGVFISGAIGSTPFSGIGTEVHPAGTFNQILPVPTTDYPFTLTSEIVLPAALPAALTLPDEFEMSLDPNKVSSGTYSVVALGPLTYQVTDIVTVYFQLSLNDGANWAANDPAFSLSTFDPATADPKIQAYLNNAVPEPLPAVLTLGGLALIGWLRMRRNHRG